MHVTGRSNSEEAQKYLFHPSNIGSGQEKVTRDVQKYSRWLMTCKNRNLPISGVWLSVVSLFVVFHWKFSTVRWRRRELQSAWSSSLSPGRALRGKCGSLVFLRHLSHELAWVALNGPVCLACTTLVNVRLLGGPLFSHTFFKENFAD